MGPRHRRIGFWILFLLWMAVQGAVATSIRAPYLAIHCGVNTSALDENLCENAACLPEVRKSRYGDYYVDNKIRIYPQTGPAYVIEWMVADYLQGQGYRYNITNKTTKILHSVCEEEIAPVLAYIQQSGFEQMYCDFYPPGKEAPGSIHQVQGWGLKCETYVSPKSNPWFYAILISESLFLGGFILLVLAAIFVLINFPTHLLLLAGMTALLVYVGKRRKASPLYVLPLLLGLIGGAIGYFATKDRRLRKRLLIAGLLVSGISFLLFAPYILSAFP